VLGLPLTVIITVINIKSNVSSENRTQDLTNLAYIRNLQHNHLAIVACLALFLFALGTIAVAVHDKAHSRVTLPAHSSTTTTTVDIPASSPPSPATTAPSIPKPPLPHPHPHQSTGKKGRKRAQTTSIVVWAQGKFFFFLSFFFY